jgi:hypothetical protein
LFLCSILWLSMTEAPAAVVVTPVQRRLYDYFGNPAGGSLDVNQDGAADFQFGASTFCTLDFPSSSCSTHLAIGGFTSSSPTMATTAGTLLWNEITTAWPPFWYGSSISSHGFGILGRQPDSVFWHFGEPDADAYLGFRLNSSSGSQFGYLHFQFVDWTTPKRNVRDFAGNPMLMGWALETELNAPIRVVPIPEPGVLGLVCACAMALSFRRRVAFQNG